MAWKYPPNSIRSDYVIDSVAVNENFLAVVEETGGFLNEHNFEASLDFVVKRPQLTSGYCMKLYRSKIDVDSGSNTIPAGSTLPTNWVSISKTPSFQSFPDQGLTLTFTSRGGPTWLCASFTLHNTALGEGRAGGLRTFASGGEPGAYPVNDGTVVALRKGFGFNCALQLDGSILYESLVGSGDATNDFFVDTHNAYDPTKVYPKGGGGVQGAANAIVIDTVVDLEPGEHTVNVVIQNILSSNGVDPNKAAISSREIFALELTR